MDYEKIKVSERDIGLDGISNLINKINKASEKTNRILLDFKGIKTLNSGGIGVLIRSHKDLMLAQGGLAMFNVSETLLNVCENSGLSRIVRIFETEENYKTFIAPKP